MLWSIGKVRGLYAVSPGEETEGYGEKDWQKRKVLSLEWKSEGVMNDESGESMEPMEELLPPSLSTAASVLAMTLCQRLSVTSQYSVKTYGADQADFWRRCLHQPFLHTRKFEYLQQ